MWSPLFTNAMRVTAQRLMRDADAERQALAQAWLDESSVCEEVGEYRQAERAAVYAFRIASGMNHVSELPLTQSDPYGRDVV